jgi:hypothetical protein
MLKSTGMEGHCVIGSCRFSGESGKNICSTHKYGVSLESLTIVGAEGKVISQWLSFHRVYILMLRDDNFQKGCMPGFLTKIDT